ncbi:MAG: YgiT-type zinc finger protein [archaeon]
MKCPICNKGEMESIKDTIKEDNIEFEAFRCKHCGEEIMNMKQLNVLANKYRKMRKAKEITFSKWGNSIAVRIPTDIANSYKITSGSNGILTKEKDGIKIIPV